MLSGENGILKQAAKAKTETEKASDLEKVQLAVTSALTEGLGRVDIEDTTGNTKGSLYKALEADGITGYTGNGVVKYNGKTYVISKNGNVTTITFSKTGDLAIGSEVTASNGEKFYVIGFSADNTKVNLLAKYNLKADGSSQDTTGANNACAFSDTNYWSGETSYPVDLNNYKLNDSEVQAKIKPTDATEVAKKYGSNLGVTGRLMTYEEAASLDVSATSSILYGQYEEGKFLNYWLGSADFGVDVVWYVDGGLGGLSGDYFNGSYFGVRPVIEVSASSIQ